MIHCIKKGNDKINISFIFVYWRSLKVINTFIGAFKLHKSSDIYFLITQII